MILVIGVYMLNASDQGSRQIHMLMATNFHTIEQVGDMLNFYYADKKHFTAKFKTAEHAKHAAKKIFYDHHKGKKTIDITEYQGGE